MADMTAREAIALLKKRVKESKGYLAKFEKSILSKASIEGTKRGIELYELCISALEAQIPRVLTQAEIDKTDYTVDQPFWFELKGTLVTEVQNAAYSKQHNYHRDECYGKTGRYWTGKPTAAQMYATKWSE